MDFDSVSRTHVGLKRRINEDSLLVRAERGLFAVADGMGGHEAGDVASGRIVAALDALESEADPDRAAGAAIDAIERVNEDLLALAGGSRTIGSTVVGLTIAGGQFRCFWAGDSRAYLLRGETFARLTRDHSLVQDLVEAGMLSEAEAVNHPNSSVITRAVGVRPELEVELVGGRAERGDRFLLASDGLTRVVEDEELRRELLRPSIRPGADRLVETVLDRGAPDNVTLIIVEVQ